MPDPEMMKNLRERIRKFQDKTLPPSNKELFGLIFDMYELIAVLNVKGCPSGREHRAEALEEHKKITKKKKEQEKEMAREFLEAM